MTSNRPYDGWVIYNPEQMHFWNKLLTNKTQETVNKLTCFQKSNKVTKQYLEYLHVSITFIHFLIKAHTKP